MSVSTAEIEEEIEIPAGYGGLRRCSPDESRRGPVQTKMVHFPSESEILDEDPVTEDTPDYEQVYKHELRGRGRSKPHNSQDIDKETLDMQADFTDLFSNSDDITDGSARDNPWVTLVSTNNAPFSPKPPLSGQRSSRGGSSAGSRLKYEGIKGENREQMISRLIDMRNVYSPLPKSVNEDPTLSPNPWIRELSTRYSRKLAHVALEKEQIRTHNAMAKAAAAATAVNIDRPRSSRSRSRSPLSSQPPSPRSRGTTPGSPTSGSAVTGPEWERVIIHPTVRPSSVGGSSPRPRPEYRSGNNVCAEDSVIVRVDSGEIAANNTDVLFMDTGLGEIMSPYFAGESFLEAIPAVPEHVIQKAYDVRAKRPGSKGSNGSRPVSRSMGMSSQGVGVGGSITASAVAAPGSRPVSRSCPGTRPGSSVVKIPLSAARPSPPQRPKSSPGIYRPPPTITPWGTRIKTPKASQKVKTIPLSADSPASPQGSGGRRLRPPYSATSISISDYYDEITDPDIPSSSGPRCGSICTNMNNDIDTDAKSCTDNNAAAGVGGVTADSPKRVGGLSGSGRSRSNSTMSIGSTGENEDKYGSFSIQKDKGTATEDKFELEVKKITGKSTMANLGGIFAGRSKAHAAAVAAAQQKPTYGTYGAAVTETIDPAREFLQGPYRTDHALKVGVPTAIAAGKFLSKVKFKRTGASFIADFDGGVDADGPKRSTSFLEVVEQKRKQHALREKAMDLYLKLEESRKRQEEREAQQRHFSVTAARQEEVELAMAYASIAAVVDDAVGGNGAGAAANANSNTCVDADTGVSVGVGGSSSKNVITGPRKNRKASISISKVAERKYAGLVQRHDFNRALAEGIEHVHAPPTEHQRIESPTEIFHHEIVIDSFTADSVGSTGTSPSTGNGRGRGSTDTVAYTDADGITQRTLFKGTKDDNNDSDNDDDDNDNEVGLVPAGLMDVDHMAGAHDVTEWDDETELAESTSHGSGLNGSTHSSAVARNHGFSASSIPVANSFCSDNVKLAPPATSFVAAPPANKPDLEEPEEYLVPQAQSEHEKMGLETTAATSAVTTVVPEPTADSTPEPTSEPKTSSGFRFFKRNFPKW